MNHSKLAINGGEPIRRRAWPTWPVVNDDLGETLMAVAKSGRWSVSGCYQDHPSYTERFASEFAAYCGTSYCIPTASGTASLIVALEAAGIGAGDEVIIPGLSWVATATTITAVNAVPIMVDVDYESLCLNPEEIERKLSPRTKAIVVVHLYSALANMEKIRKIADYHGLVIIEDSAQSHGAMLGNSRVGSIGDIGTFSMQHSKLLTCGEGGAVVTNNANFARRVEQLRTDGRMVSKPCKKGRMELCEVGEITGNNRCISEFGAAILSKQLQLLDLQNSLRQRNVALLTTLLADLGIAIQDTDAATSIRTFYCLAVRFEKSHPFSWIGLEKLCDCMSEELNLNISRIYRPLNKNILYNPSNRRRYRISDEHITRLAIDQHQLPECGRAYENYITFPHHMLLASESDMNDVVDAFSKILSNQHSIC